MKPLHPPGWPRPGGYANGIVAEGKQIFVAGQIAWDPTGALVGNDFVGQARQALSNIVTILAEAGAGPQHVVRLIWYVTDKHEYLEQLRDVGAAYREVMGNHYPAMTLVEVADLLEDGAKVEIEATAVLPENT